MQLRDFEPVRVEREGLPHAAVALVLAERAGRSEILFIERATREGDPWSGHMAFPGGRMEPEDSSPRAAAERETHEEVGISLEGAEYLGLLGDLQGNPKYRPSNLVVSAHVFQIDDPVPAVPDEREVRAAMWFPLHELHSPDRHVDYTVARMDYKFPGILVGEPDRHIVWGLTYRFLDIFFEAVDRPLPDRWAGLHPDFGERSGRD